MINWSRGMTTKYYGAMVNPETWKDEYTFDIISGSIKYSKDGLRESADIECRNFDPNNECWIRIYMDARQGEESELIPLFTGLASVPDITYEGRIDTEKIKCYSVLGPADQVLLPLGWNVLAGANGGETIRDLLMNVIPAQVIIDGVSPGLTKNIISENGETHLTMVEKILDAINWRMKIDGDGTIILCPQATDISGTFDYAVNDVVGMSLSIKKDWYAVPNVFRAVAEGMMAIARDEDPNSRFSIPNRGREIWMEETNIVLNENEKIGEYADRRLKEEQNLYLTINYNRRFDPNVKISDLVRIRYPEQGINGIFEITSQSLNLSYAGEVSEEAIGIY